jgi:hypothetical protein
VRRDRGPVTPEKPQSRRPRSSPDTLRVFLCGDVMTGRGIDQVMAHPCSPNLYEGYAQSALDYVHLAEIANGPIPQGREAPRQAIPRTPPGPHTRTAYGSRPAPRTRQARRTTNRRNFR